MLVEYDQLICVRTQKSPLDNAERPFQDRTNINGF
jgi:hypothetical protein